MRSTHRFPALRSDDIFLAPGELHCGFGPGRVWTILGSCVSIVLWHRKLVFGAMSHYLLPYRGDGDTTRRHAPDARYGVESCKLMLSALRNAGVQPRECQAYLFGGSHMLVNGKPSGNAIGHRNAAVAHEFLEQHEIRLLSESLFGDGHRRVCLDIGTGRVWESVTREGVAKRTHRRTGDAA